MKNIIRYFFVGSSAALVDVSIFYLFAYCLNFNYFIVGAVGFIVATLVNYFLSILFVFKSGARFSQKLEIFFIYVVSIVGLSLNLIILYCAIDVIFIDKMLSKIIATSAVFIWNYTLRRYFIFKNPENPNANSIFSQ